jgi:hypothetical protein
MAPGTVTLKSLNTANVPACKLCAGHLPRMIAFLILYVYFQNLKNVFLG